MSVLSSPTARPWVLSGPALVLFAALLLTPIVMTVLLSFREFSFYGGISDTLGLSNYVEILGDSYFYEIFLRTVLIALGTTVLCVLLGVPEASFIHRMGAFWRSLGGDVHVLREEVPCSSALTERRALP